MNFKVISKLGINWDIIYIFTELKYYLACIWNIYYLIAWVFIIILIQLSFSLLISISNLFTFHTNKIILSSKIETVSDIRKLFVVNTVIAFKVL